MPETFTTYDDNDQPRERVYFSVKEAADQLHVSTATVYERVRSRAWPALQLTDHRIWFSTAHLNRILELADRPEHNGIPDQSEQPPRLGQPVDLDETGPLE